MTEDQISKIILDCAFKIHKTLGPGLLERAYRECLAYELNKYGLEVEVEKSIPLIYENIKMDCGYRIDLLIDKKVIIELKSIDGFNEVHIAQTLTYMRLSGCKLGMLLNFNTKMLRNGIKRLVL
jgi:GxxExxY protein